MINIFKTKRIKIENAFFEKMTDVSTNIRKILK